VTNSRPQKAYEGPRKRAKVDWTLLFLLGVALLLGAVAWQRGGAQLAVEGLKAGGEILLSVTLLLFAAFVVAGLTQVLLSREIIERWLGARAGWRGILLGCLAGGLIPGGPYVYYPIAAAFLHSGAGLGVLVSFVTAKNLWSVSRLPLEVALLGPRLTLIRFTLTLVLPPILGMLAERLFGGLVDSIREAAP
jgi:uncharacterized membrane protein YraQ (UPF0718 family)